MSVRVMSRVWDYFPDGGGALLVMLAFADFANDYGSGIHPSMATLGRKIRLSECQARRIVHDLVDAGFLRVVGNVNGGAPTMTRQYLIVLDRLTPSADATPSAGATPSDGAYQPLAPVRETPSTHASRTIKNQKSEPVDARERAAPVSARVRKDECTLREFIDRCKANEEKAIGDDDPVFTYADKVGIDHEMIEVCWREFKAAYLSSNKCRKDWRAMFRNAVRRNWYKLWYLPSGEPAKWSTPGEQARRDAA